MNHPIFSYHLSWAVLRRMTVASFAASLGHATPRLARSWVSGEALPPVTELRAIARVLAADPIEMLMVWTADASAFTDPNVLAEACAQLGFKATLSNDREIYDFRIDDRMFDRT
jgi:hypothetical protein